jgi:hypothetical protein
LDSTARKSNSSGDALARDAGGSAGPCPLARPFIKNIKPAKMMLFIKR